MIKYNTYNLFLDDERFPYSENPDVLTAYYYDKFYKFRTETWIVVRNYKEFTNIITMNGLPKLVSFDHDLQEEMTGYDCAKWLVNFCMDNELKLPEYHIHTKNPGGRENIFHILNSYNRYFDANN